MKNYRQPWGLIFLILLTSCGGTIKITNNTNAEAYMVKQWNYTGGDNDTIHFNLQPDEITVLAGYKTNWTRKSIVSYYGDISILKIVSVADTIILKNQNEIVEYLLDHRKGIFNQYILIEIGEKE